MTDPHPLTDEMCENISYFPLSDMPVLGKSIKKDMRAAYDKGRDDQLEQVIEWLRSMEQYPYMYMWDNAPEMDKDELIADLKKVMRPQQQEDDND